jgi:hypothetical protein
MFELMFDLETLDTKPSAIVLSVGAVVFETWRNDDGSLVSWTEAGDFLRVLNIQAQAEAGRSMSESTILWWMDQDSAAQREAFSRARDPVNIVLANFLNFVDKYADGETGTGINAFWASPATFDFPIWEDLAMTFAGHVPWTYRQKYDVRTVVREASYSAKGHKPASPIKGVPHQPTYDCRRQIDLLTAAREKLGRRMPEKSS